jgi:hypothetical protein
MDLPTRVKKITAVVNLTVYWFESNIIVGIKAQTEIREGGK